MTTPPPPSPQYPPGQQFPGGYYPPPVPPKKKMGIGKKILIGIAGFFVVFIAAAIIAGPADTKSTAGATSTAHVPTAEEIKHDPGFQAVYFTEQLDEKKIPYSSKDAAVNLAHAVCSSFDQGNTALQVVNTMIANNTEYTSDQIAQLLSLSVVVYCDQYQPKLSEN